VTIRAKLYAAIVLTILGPMATSAVALHGMSQMGDSFDEVHARAQDEALARELKFGVTDMNGWQTAYGYDGTGRFRAEFESSAGKLESDLASGGEALTDPREQELLGQLDGEFDRFMALDAIAFRALQEGDDARVKQIFLGPELARFEAMAATAEDLAAYEAESATAADEAFDKDRDDARKRLIAVALGAGLVIILLLVTAQDVARMALEGERSTRGRGSREGGNDEKT
jgi:Four helix bundle sensory module for signal transduction